MNHLRPAYHRASMGMSIDNPLYDLAVGEYASLHAAVCTALVTLQDSLGVVFSEQEQAYFTLFFAASIERNRLIPNRPRIALVCGTGRATSEIIRARISGRFDVEVVGTFGAREIPAWLEQHRVDLVLSLVPIELPGYDVLLIGSSFTKDDEEHLALALKPACRVDARPRRSRYRLSGCIGRWKPRRLWESRSMQTCKHFSAQGASVAGHLYRVRRAR